MASARNFTFFFLFLQKRDFLYRYWGDIHRRFFSFLQLSPSKQGESFLVLMTPMGLCGRNKSSKNVKKTRGVLSWHPLVAAPNDTEGHGVWKSQKKSHFNIASEASYVYILSGQKFIKKPKMVNFGVFDGKWQNSKTQMRQFKLFQTMCTVGKSEEIVLEVSFVFLWMSNQGDFNERMKSNKRNMMNE